MSWKNYDLLNNGPSTHAPLHETAHQWMKVICSGQEDAEVATCSGMPVTITDNKHVENIHAILNENQNTMCKSTAAEVGISTSVFHILTKHLGKKKVYTKWIPQCLTEDQCATRVVVHFTSPMMGEWSKTLFSSFPHVTVEDSCMKNWRFSKNDACHVFSFLLWRKCVDKAVPPQTLLSST